jgi:aspartyl-tRNA(Asn)/glutamyl-tRNA(Gln) amidotransferase subunit B
MPPLAHEIKERLARHGLAPHDMDILMAIDSKNEVRFDGQRSPGAVTYFEALAKGRNSKIVVNWCAILLFNGSDSGLNLPLQLNCTVKDNT